MDNNPKKSKALIITFVVVLLLLIAGYFLFSNSDKIFGTKGTIDFNKIFSPLLGTSKKTDLNPLDNGLNKTDETGACTNGADNPPTCTTINGKCLNGAINP